MLQQFIELGEGYSDLFELIELAKSNQHRLIQMLALHSVVNEKPVTSLAIVLQATDPGEFQPIYICREGIPNPHVNPNKRYQLFEQLAAECNKHIIEFEVRSSQTFAEKALYYQYLIGILRMNNVIPRLT
ncbi:DUF7147 family protein [Heyndrickxia ginsengihumi]|uniref:Methylthioribose kinase n=1 Tax=Heyndrickxia ginsengihumi TaxID=363870 RepID=A0A0A6VB15_9BACI|nr:hypothetical protein [Heyndrickxia ginsengihumi]KHD84693.1 methylthioribose kinase [Heyndrickxia ginsengihumi]MBE6183675.1 methylthioribose kinase [Bacillus sp. (in: firmicutes)]MCM3022385.1 methylthioribose kinase [Heyndrickxia ginsengihumi]NEY18673.1 methylthioribose kinase [Heyndrickxia ginsengihumi]